MLHLILLFVGHYVSDFVCQPRFIADTKSDSLRMLTVHVVTYTVLMSFFALAVGGFKFMLLFGLVTFVTHAIIDKITSTHSKKFYKQKKYYAMFNVIGFDQLLHIIQIVITYNLLK